MVAAVTDIKTLQKERDKLRAETKAIREKSKEEDREVTAEELEQIEANTAKRAELREQITTARAAEQRRQEVLAADDAEDDWEDQPQQPITRPNPAAGRTSRVNLLRGEDTDKFRDFGDFLECVRYANENNTNHLKLQQRLQAVSGASTTVDSELGFLVPPEISRRILEHITTASKILSLPFFGVQLTGNTWQCPYINEFSQADGSRSGGVRGYWVGEGTAPTATEPTVGQVELKLHKAGCLGYVTEEMLEDYTATGALMERVFAKELRWKVEDGIVRGDGSKKPMGLKNAACKIAITKETNQTADTIWGPNIVKMWARRNEGGEDNNVWLVNQDTEPYLWSLTLEGRWGSASTAVDGVPLYHPAGSITNQGKFGILMGRPVIPVPYCDTIGTAGDIILFDPSQYILATKSGGGISIDDSIHVKFAEHERTYRAFYRVDGQPWWRTAMTPYQGTNTQSPIITLGSRD